MLEETEEAPSIMDALGIDEKAMREAVLFPLPSEGKEKIVDCIVTSEMSRKEADDKLINFYKNMRAHNIPVGANLRLQMLDRKVTGAFVCCFPQAVYDDCIQYICKQGLAVPESFPLKVDGPAAYVVNKEVLLAEAVMTIFGVQKVPFTVGFAPQYQGSYIIYVKLADDKLMDAIMNPITISGKPHHPIFSQPTPSMEEYYVFGFSGTESAKFLLESAFAKAGITSALIRRAPNTTMFVAKVSMPFSLQTMDKMQRLCNGGPCTVTNPRQPDEKGYQVWFGHNMVQLEQATGKALARSLEQLSLGSEAEVIKQLPPPPEPATTGTAESKSPKNGGAQTTPLECNDTFGALSLPAFFFDSCSHSDASPTHWTMNLPRQDPLVSPKPAPPTSHHPPPIHPPPTAPLPVDSRCALSPPTRAYTTTDKYSMSSRIEEAHPHDAAATGAERCDTDVFAGTVKPYDQNGSTEREARSDSGLNEAPALHLVRHFACQTPSEAHDSPWTFLGQCARACILVGQRSVTIAACLPRMFPLFVAVVSCITAFGWFTQATTHYHPMSPANINLSQPCPPPTPDPHTCLHKMHKRRDRRDQSHSDGVVRAYPVD